MALADEKCCGNVEETCNFPKHPKPKPCFLECGFNPQDAIFEIYRDRVKDHQAFVLDRVLVDTTCLFKPVVKIEFSSLVYFEAEADGWRQPSSGCDESAAPGTSKYPCGDKELKVDLLFELVRTCNGVTDCVQSWRYLKEYEIKRSDDLEVKFSEPFTVTFCDKMCPGCCEYKMIVKGIDFDGKFKALRVVKPDISSIAQNQCNCQ